MILIPAAVKFIMVTGPDQQAIEVNPAEIVSLRPPRVREHFSAGIRCLLNTVDGKFIVVRETCHDVQTRIDGADK